MLANIELAVNQLTGDLSPLSELQMLSSLYLRENNLSGPLDGIASLTGLTMFDGSWNQLSGSLTPLSNLVKVKALKLQNNQLNGDLTPLAALSALSFVDLGRNRISSTLQTFSSLPSLTSIYLNGNLITGSLGPLANLPHLNQLDVSSNLINGTLEPLEDMPLLHQIYAFSNLIVGTVPPSLGCDDGSTKCVMFPNYFMCGDQERIIGTSCVSCANCGTEASGSCSDNFDSDSYFCSTCGPDHFEAGGTCTSCSSPLSFSSWESLLLVFCSILVVGSVGAILVKKNLVSVPTISLNLKNQIRVRQFAAVFQMLALLVSLSLGYPQWLKSIASALDSVSLPLSVNTPCVRGLQDIERWQRGLISFLALCVILSMLLFAKPILTLFGCFPPIRAKHFMNMQILASLFVTQSVAVLLPMCLNFDELVGETIVDASEYAGLFEEVNAIFVDKAVKIAATISVVVLIASSAVLLVDHAHNKYQVARRSFLEKDGDNEELSEDDQVDQLLPFWSTFCLSYVPRSANFESKVLRRRIMCFILPSLCRGAATLAMSSQSVMGAYDSLLLESVSSGVEILGAVENIKNIQLVGACLEALCFVLLNVLYLRHQIKRPYISPRPSAAHGDPLNDAEMLISRVLSWGAVLFCLRLVLTEKLEQDLTWLVTCLSIALLAALAFSQRALFQGIVDDVKSELDVFGEREGSREGSGWLGGRGRGNSALSEFGEGGKIEQMMESKSALDMWRLQKNLQGPLLLESEKSRWVVEEEEVISRWRWWLSRAGALLGMVLGSIVLVFFLFVLSWMLSTNDAWLVLLCAVLVGSAAAMEIYLARNNAPVAGERITAAPTQQQQVVVVDGGNSGSGDQDEDDDYDHGDNDDDDDDIEMATINPVLKVNAAGASVLTKSPGDDSEPYNEGGGNENDKDREEEEEVVVEEEEEEEEEEDAAKDSAARLSLSVPAAADVEDDEEKRRVDADNFSDIGDAVAVARRSSSPPPAKIN
jgi:hypothetical protein